MLLDFMFIATLNALLSSSKFVWDCLIRPTRTGMFSHFRTKSRNDIETLGINGGSRRYCYHPV